MGARVGSVVINCRDLDRMTAFWMAALSLRPGATSSDGHFRVLVGPNMNVALQHSARAARPPGHIHLDLYVPDPAEYRTEVRRLVGLGARRVREVHGEAGHGFVVMTDPEGNPFCVCH